MNIEAKVLNKYISKLNTAMHQKSYNMIKWALFQECKVGTSFANQ